MRTILDELKKLSKSDQYPLHMPGHKRNVRPFSDAFALDITEIEGFDNLHHAQGLLLEAQEWAAVLYGAEESFFLINGSTCGILSAVSAAVPRGGRLLMARNCHKSAYHAACLRGLSVRYLYPEIHAPYGICGGITAEQVRLALLKEKASAVLITSPTYDGVVSDVRGIARVAHEAGAILIVDEAHGAHFALHPLFPDSALACGADLVINSLHKTLPSLTQTALLHVCGKRVDRERLRKYLGMYQSSSPSYVLMASIDSCVKYFLENREDFSAFHWRIEALRRNLSHMEHLHLIDTDFYGYTSDRSKMLIGGMPGPELGRILRHKYRLEPEMEAAGYLLAILTIGDTAEGLERFEQALLEIDRELAEAKESEAQPENEGVRQTDGTVCEAVKTEAAGVPSVAAEAVRMPGVAVDVEAVARPQAVYRMAEVEEKRTVAVSLEEAGGWISAEFVYVYPPGIPFVVPGERIPREMPRLLQCYRELGIGLQGMADLQGRKIRVLEET